MLMFRWCTHICFLIDVYLLQWRSPWKKNNQISRSRFFTFPLGVDHKNLFSLLEKVFFLRSSFWKHILSVKNSSCEKGIYATRPAWISIHLSQYYIPDPNVLGSLLKSCLLISLYHCSQASRPEIKRNSINSEFWHLTSTLFVGT